MTGQYNVILASGSPRRKEIMDNLGIKYTAVPSSKEEHMSDDIEPSELVRQLSAMKASDILEEAEPGSVVIGADTVVAIDGHVLGKPKDGPDAYEMLKILSGRQHHVFTGICIIIKQLDGKIRKKSFYSDTLVNVYEMSDNEINTYIATGEPMDKAGAYAIQGLFAPYIQSIEGDYYNIVGFPIASIYHELRDMGIDLLNN